MSAPTDICADCGHPRHLHVHCSNTYPALCTHAAPRAVDAEPDWEGVCMCLDFSDDPVPIYGPLSFVGSENRSNE